MELRMPDNLVIPRNQRAGVSKSDEPLLNPFTIIVDTAEQHFYAFQGLHADSDRHNRELIVTLGVNLIQRCLGRHPLSLGDYSIDGYVGRCHVERKSMEDAHGTILGWPGEAANNGGIGRRERFEQELANLSNCQAAAVVVECSLGQLIDEAPEYDLGRKTKACNQKILERSIIAFQQSYSVPWFFCDSRRMAEVVTFRFLERFFEKNRPKRRRREA